PPGARRNSRRAAGDRRSPGSGGEGATGRGHALLRSGAAGPPPERWEGRRQPAEEGSGARPERRRDLLPAGAGRAAGGRPGCRVPDHVDLPPAAAGEARAGRRPGRHRPAPGRPGPLRAGHPSLRIRGPASAGRGHPRRCPPSLCRAATRRSPLPEGRTSMDDTKKSLGVAAIVAAVVALIGILYLLYHFTMAPRPNNVSKEMAPDYAKKAGMTDNPTGATVRPSYGQGPGYAGGGPGGPMGGRPGGYGGA